jgi:hypothetical protein
VRHGSGIAEEGEDGEGNRIGEVMKKKKKKKLEENVVSRRAFLTQTRNRL